MSTVDQHIRERLALGSHEDWCGDDDEGCNCFLGPVNDAIRAVLDIERGAEDSIRGRAWNRALDRVRDEMAIALGITQEATNGD